jgi:hypothetical protein
MPDGAPEGYLLAKKSETLLAQTLEMQETLSLTPRFSGVQSGPSEPTNPFKGFSATQMTETRARRLGGTLPIAANTGLVDYLLDNRNYHIIQHGCRHDYWEFDRLPDSQIGARLDEGTQLLVEAGFRRPETFVAPYDKLSRGSLLEVARRFRVLSTGWYELRRLPLAWWPKYALKKLRGVSDWKIGRTLLLSHPGCLLSYTRAYDTMLDTIIQHIHDQHLTVLVTHWWEYFRNGQPDEPLIEVLHETGDYLATHPQIKVITFADLANGHLCLD